jgi:phosphoribosylamine---glycine ligase
MNVLIIGSGGREHALAWKLSQSKKLNNIYVAPGNAGTSTIAKNIDINVADFTILADYIDNNNINLLVVGPEDPLVNGIVDFLKQHPKTNKLKIIGPDKSGALLEGSKEYAKQFMQKYNIPTAKYKAFTKDSLKEAFLFLEELEPPYVLKADGLAAGKGVIILNNISEAKDSLTEMLNGKFGNAGNTVVIEEFLDGVEYSVFALTDGKDFLILPEAKDYKRIGENNTGLNTGGMGAVSPVPFFNNDFKQQTIDKIIKPTIDGINAEGYDYKGFVFFGLINVKNKPYVIEYNVRLGDPETEVVLPRIDSDLLDLFIATADNKISEKQIQISPKSVSTVMLVSGGYPESYEKGKVISGLDDIEESIVFHAGTSLLDDKICTSGGRVIAISSYGNNIFDALNKSYASIKQISFDKMYYRKDLGFDLK